jgi:hypothetical protein
MTSSHTSFAAARAPARLPSAALLQIASTFAFVLALSVGASLITDLHSATASARPAELAGLGIVLGVLAALGVLGVLDVVPVDAGVELVVAVVAAGELLWLLVEEELLLLPHPAMNTLPMTTTASHLDLCLNILCPLDQSRIGRLPASFSAFVAEARPGNATPAHGSLAAAHSAGEAPRSRMTRPVRPPAALNSMPAIPVITIRNGGKLPSETFAWVPRIACTTSSATP